VVAALEESKVKYKISRAGGSILVAADKVHTMRMQLASKGIPKGEGVGFEIFDKPNFGISDFVQRANYLRAVQGELARTIGQVDMIEHARVMLVMPENRLLLDMQKTPTASVFVQVRGNGQLPAQSVSAIRFLVANAVEGLKVNNVTIIDNLGNVLAENDEKDSLSGLSGTQLSARKNFEQYLAKKAEGMLERVLGSGQAVVRVSTDINFDSVSTTEERFDPESQVVRSSVVNDENVETAAPVGSGSGAAPKASEENASANNSTNAAASTPVSSSRTRKKVVNNQYEVNKITSNLVQAAGGLKRVSAAVFVASRMEGTGADRKPVPRSKEEMEKLRHIVQSALGIQEGAEGTRKDEITLEEIPFNDSQAVEITQTLKKQETTQFWWEVGKNVAYPALGLIALVVFWRAFKRTTDDDIPLGVPLGEVGADSNGVLGNGKGRNPNVPQTVTVEVLNRLIRENPENLTQSIRTWMAGKPK
jgi:flagellar M-ring protein FliF